MALSFQMMSNLISVAAVVAILAIISGLDPSSKIIALRYLNFFTVSSFSPLAVMSHCIPLLLFVINIVLFAMISMPQAVEDLSRCQTRFSSSCSELASPPILSAKRRFVNIPPPMFTVPLCSSSASVIILSRKILKRVGESRHPFLTLTVV